MKEICFTMNVILIFILLSCNSNRKNTTPILKVSDDILEHNIKLSELISDYKIIPLETTENGIIGQPDKIIVHDDQFFILDSRKAKTVFVFSREGKFIRKIGKNGKGPGEYNAPRDFCFVPGSNNLAIVDDKRVLLYSIEGTYSKTIVLPIPAWRIEFTDANHIACVPMGDANEMIIVNLESRKHVSYFKYVKETHKILNFPFIHYGDSGILFLHNLDYMIYKINGTKISPHIAIDFDKNMFTEKDLQSLKEDMNNEDRFFKIKHYFESASHIVILSYLNRVPYYIFHNKISGATKYMMLNEIENDITGSNISRFVIWSKSPDDFFISCIEAIDFKDSSLIEKNIANSNQPVNHLQLIENPVLVLFKLR